MSGAPGPGFALYVHWPFCLAKCPYCDFNSHVAREAPDGAAWRAALLAALDLAAAETPGRTLASVFFGGGTPSLMPPGIVSAILDRAGAHWRLEDGLEVTLEANPTSVEAARLGAFRTAGVNRLSLGIQALDDEALAFLGRHHSAAEALAALETAGRVFGRLSFDLIYARPGQTLALWEGELSRALALAGDHLSLYQLTIEDGTQFATRHARGDLALPGEDLAAELFEATQALCAAAGLPAYEISNHARPGGESRHNLVYWRYGDYAGIGPGAHGRLTDAAGAKWATRQVKAPAAWLTAAASGRAEAERVALSRRERLEEALMMGLRLTEGVTLARLDEEAGLSPVLDPLRVDRLVAAGFLDHGSGTLRATAAGRLRLNAVLAALLA